jgi:YVTN family beta-propeller protein
VAGSIIGKKINVIDQKTEEIVWTLPMEEGVRPMAFETNPDGSTNGSSWSSPTSTASSPSISRPQSRRQDPDARGGGVEKTTVGLQGSPCHGLAVTPDGKTLTVLSKMNSRVYFVSLPDLKIVGETKVGHHPDWITLTPDGKRAYVANAGSNSVSVVDIATRKELTQIPVGQVPKRNITAVLPEQHDRGRLFTKTQCASRPRIFFC